MYVIDVCEHTDVIEKVVACQSYQGDFLGRTMPEQGFKREWEFPASSRQLHLRKEKTDSANVQKLSVLHAVSEGLLSPLRPMCGPHKLITFTINVAFYRKLFFKSLSH